MPFNGPIPFNGPLNILPNGQIRPLIVAPPTPDGSMPLIGNPLTGNPHLPPGAGLMFPPGLRPGSYDPMTPAIFGPPPLHPPRIIIGPSPNPTTRFRNQNAKDLYTNVLKEMLGKPTRYDNQANGSVSWDEDKGFGANKARVRHVLRDTTVTNQRRDAADGGGGVVGAPYEMILETTFAMNEGAAGAANVFNIAEIATINSRLGAGSCVARRSGNTWTITIKSDTLARNYMVMNTILNSADYGTDLDEGVIGAGWTANNNTLAPSQNTLNTVSPNVNTHAIAIV